MQCIAHRAPNADRFTSLSSLACDRVGFVSRGTRRWRLVRRGASSFWPTIVASFILSPGGLRRSGPWRRMSTRRLWATSSKGSGARMRRYGPGETAVRFPGRTQCEGVIRTMLASERASPCRGDPMHTDLRTHSLDAHHTELPRTCGRWWNRRRGACPSRPSPSLRMSCSRYACLRADRPDGPPFPRCSMHARPGGERDLAAWASRHHR